MLSEQTDAHLLELEMDASCLSREHTLSPALPCGDTSYSAGNLHLTRENANNAQRTFRLMSTQINARSKESLLTTLRTMRRYLPDVTYRRKGVFGLKLEWMGSSVEGKACWWDSLTSAKSRACSGQGRSRSQEKTGCS